MNALAGDFDCVPRLGTDLREQRTKWKEVKDWKKYVSVIQLSLATFFRLMNVTTELFGYFLMGAARSANSVAMSFDAMETHYVWADSGRYAGITNDYGHCACLWMCITTALIAAGCGVVLASILFWLLSYLFVFLSFLWCFRTDIEFELNYAIEMGEINEAIDRWTNEVPQALTPEYMAVFKERQEKKLRKLNERKEELTAKFNEEREKRAKRSKTDFEAVPQTEVAVAAEITAETNVPKEESTPAVVDIEAVQVVNEVVPI